LSDLFFTMPFEVHSTSSAQATTELGHLLAAKMQAPEVILLVGDLGSGKTTLAKGIIQGLGVANPEDVLSPTFSLIHEYEGPPKVYHIDLYRLDHIPQIETLGLEDLWDKPAIVLIEWGEKFTHLFPSTRKIIQILDRGEDLREISVSSTETEIG